MSLVFLWPCLFIHLWEQDAEDLAESDVLVTSPLQGAHVPVTVTILCIIFAVYNVFLMIVLLY